jgi:hypothetical protein
MFLQYYWRCACGAPACRCARTGTERSLQLFWCASPSRVLHAYCTTAGMTNALVEVNAVGIAWSRKALLRGSLPT